MKIEGIGCLVTGASDGIGRALAVELGRRRCRVGLLARREGVLARVVEEVVAAGGIATPLAVDVRNAGSVAAAVARAREACGPLRLVVVNAGVGVHGALADLPETTERNVMDVNFHGALATVRAVVPELRAAAPAALVAVASLSALIPYRGGGAYGASKAALVAALRCLRLELQDTGVGVGILCPAQVDTAMIVEGVPHAKLPRLARLAIPVLPVERAVRAIVRLGESGGGEKVIPWQAASFAALARHLPRTSRWIEIVSGAGEV
ncbi:MAG: SDR family NAD(P)-dependent oxidoreductase [Acidobacteriota bacterium]